jgi:hypothetical protein
MTADMGAPESDWPASANASAASPRLRRTATAALRAPVVWHAEDPELLALASRRRRGQRCRTSSRRGALVLLAGAGGPRGHTTPAWQVPGRTLRPDAGLPGLLPGSPGRNRSSGEHAPCPDQRVGRSAPPMPAFNHVASLSKRAPCVGRMASAGLNCSATAITTTTATSATPATPVTRAATVPGRWRPRPWKHRRLSATGSAPTSNPSTSSTTKPWPGARPRMAGAQ